MCLPTLHSGKIVSFLCKIAQLSQTGVKAILKSSHKFFSLLSHEYALIKTVALRLWLYALEDKCPPHFETDALACSCWRTASLQHNAATTYSSQDHQSKALMILKNRETCFLTKGSRKKSKETKTFKYSFKGNKKKTYFSICAGLKGGWIQTTHFHIFGESHNPSGIYWVLWFYCGNM